MTSLYDSLHGVAEQPTMVTSNSEPDYTLLSGKEFAEAVLKSNEFRTYVVRGLSSGDLPSAVLCRLMDYGWGKPAERVEHSGVAGNPIITEVRRVIVRAPALEEFEVDLTKTSRERMH